MAGASVNKFLGVPGEQGGRHKGNDTADAGKRPSNRQEDASADTIATERSQQEAPEAARSSRQTAATALPLFLEAKPLDDEGVLTLIELSSTHPIILNANTRLQKDLLEAANKACAEAAELEALSREELRRIQQKGSGVEKAEDDTTNTVRQQPQQHHDEKQHGGKEEEEAAAAKQQRGDTVSREVQNHRDDEEKASKGSSSSNSPEAARDNETKDSNRATTEDRAVAPSTQHKGDLDEGGGEDHQPLQKEEQQQQLVLLTPEILAEAGAVALKDKRQLLEGQMKRCRMLLDACHGLIVDLDSLDFATLKPLWGDERSVRQSRKCLTQLIEKMTDRLEAANSFLKKIYVRLPPLPPSSSTCTSCTSSMLHASKSHHPANVSAYGSAATAEDPLTATLTAATSDGAVLTKTEREITKGKSESNSYTHSALHSDPFSHSLLSTQTSSKATATTSSSADTRLPPAALGAAPRSPSLHTETPPATTTLTAAAGTTATAGTDAQAANTEETYVGLIPGDLPRSSFTRGRGTLPGGASGRGRGVLLAAGRGRGVGVGRGASSSSSSSESDSEKDTGRGMQQHGHHGSNITAATNIDSQLKRGGESTMTGVGEDGSGTEQGKRPLHGTETQQRQQQHQKQQQEEHEGNRHERNAATADDSTTTTSTTNTRRSRGRGENVAGADERRSPPRWKRRAPSDVDWLLKCRKKLCELKERTVRKAVSDVFIKDRTVQETIEFMNNNAEKLKTVAEKPKAAITTDDRRVFMRSIESYIAGLDKACSLVAKQAMNKRQLMSLFESACKIEKFQTPHELLMEMKNTVSLLQTFAYMPPSRDDDSS